MAFERFERRGAPAARSAIVTVQKGGVIALNEAAFKMLGGTSYVELFFDRKRRVIGIKAAEQGPNTYHLRQAVSGSQRLLSASAFTKAYDIDTTYGRRYEPFVEDGMLCIDLSQDQKLPTLL